MTDTTARMYTAAEVAAARAAGEEAARESWSKFHKIMVDSLEHKHRRELQAVQESLGIEQRRNRIDADALITAKEDARILSDIAAVVFDPTPGLFGRRARRQVAEVWRLLFGGDES